VFSDQPLVMFSVQVFVAVPRQVFAQPAEQASYPDLRLSDVQIFVPGFGPVFVPAVFLPEVLRHLRELLPNF